MKKEKKIIWLLTGIAAVSLLVLCTVVIVRTATYPFIRTTGPDGPPRSVEPSAQAVERLAGGIRIPTVSDAIDRTDDNPFQAFKAYLPQAYPAIYSQLDTLTINEYGLVFRWPGKNPALPPILLCSHYDVVPVLNYDPSAPDAPLPGWDYPPFSGAVADGRIYGRGTLDMKGMLFSILEARFGGWAWKRFFLLSAESEYMGELNCICHRDAFVCAGDFCTETHDVKDYH